MKRSVFIVISVTLVFIILSAIFLRTKYGGGKEYRYDPGKALYDKSALDVYFSHPNPIGNVAATKDSSTTERVFFTVHPESRPEKLKLFEITGENALPYPSEEFQKEFNTPLGVFADFQNRLWTIDHGQHGLMDVRLLAFDLGNNEKILDFVFPDSIAPAGSFFNDLSISPDGKYAAIANLSFFGKNPSIVIFHIEKGIAINRLQGYPELRHQDYVPVTPQKKMRFFGLVDLLIGIDGIDFSKDGRYLYWAPMGHSKLFRIASEKILDFELKDAELAEYIEEVCTKPLSDGIRTDFDGNIYVTDIEHQGVQIVFPDGSSKTLIKDPRIRWAEGFSLGSSGYIYLA